MAFTGFNVPNLHLIEDSFPQRIPTQFEQRDAVRSLAQMGATVARIYTLSIQSNVTRLTHIAEERNISASINSVWLGGFDPQSPGSPKTAPTSPNWILIPGTDAPRLYANTALFVALDSAIAEAARHGVKLIVPFIDHWHWWGGLNAFSQMHNQSAAAFYTDAKVVSNFKAVVQFVATRNNSVSGMRYSNDPAIYAWETGNELSNAHAFSSPAVSNRFYSNIASYRVPAEWTIGLATLLKSPSVNVTQPVIDGSYNIYGWDEAVLSHPLIDGFTGHYYQTGAPGNWDAIGVCASFWVLSCLILFCIWKRPAWFFIRVPETRRGLFSFICLGHCARRQRTPSRIKLKYFQNRNNPDLTDSPEFDPGFDRDRSINSRFVDHDKPTVLATVVVASLILAIISFLVAIILLLLQALPLPEQDYAKRFEQDYDTVTRYNKTFYVGEFGLATTSDYERLLSAVQNRNSQNPTKKSSGALIWSLRFHSRDGGFYVHNESDYYKSYHWPGGFALKQGKKNQTGFGADESATMALMSRFSAMSARAAGGVSANPYFEAAPSPPPVMLDAVVNVDAITQVGLTWRGSAGARSYTIQRAKVDERGRIGDFEVLAQEVTDAVESGSVLYEDLDVVAGGSYAYRVYGVSDFGRSETSNSTIVSVK
ncbi:hypothetical protein HDU77_005567 [Chytriomyces hyalinus]|nr:hypothetical protein HDU77_005567 [Chytriomyces hyalinus]